MKLSKYIEGLQEVLKEKGDLDVVYAIDDEGNGYGEVYFDPTPGSFKNEDEGEWVSESGFKEHEDYMNEDEDEEDHIKLTVNAVLIN